MRRYFAEIVQDSRCKIWHNRGGSGRAVGLPSREGIYRSVYPPEQPEAHPGFGLQLMLEEQAEKDLDFAPLHLQSLCEDSLSLAQRAAETAAA